MGGAGGGIGFHSRPSHHDRPSGETTGDGAAGRVRVNATNPRAIAVTTESITTKKMKIQRKWIPNTGSMLIQSLASDKKWCRRGDSTGPSV